MTFSPEKAIRKTGPEEEAEYFLTRKTEMEGYWPDYFNVLVIEPDIQSPVLPEPDRLNPNYGKPRPEPDPEEVKLFESWQAEHEEIHQIVIDRNKSVSQQLKEKKPGDVIDRPFMVDFKRSRDAYKDLEMQAMNRDFHTRIPELIILKNNPKLDSITRDGGIGSAIPEKIRQIIFHGLINEGMLGYEAELRPIIAIVGEFRYDNSFETKYALDHGADLLLPDMDVATLQELISLVAKIKSNPAYLNEVNAMIEKIEFYAKVEGMAMGDRSEITADTEQELEILHELLPKGRIKVLDAGCGNGRITNRLAEDPQIKLTGVDSNPRLLRQARKEHRKNTKYIESDLNDYANHEKLPHESQDAVIYTWHSFLEAFGPGNTIQTLKSAWLTLKEGGTLIFDQPTRENPDLADGWYYDKIDDETEYLSYIMTEEEINFMLKITGFENVEFVHWQTKPSEIYPEGMKKITVKAKKRLLNKE